MSKYLPINLFIRQALLYPLTSPFLPPIDKVEKDYSYAAGRLLGTLEAPAATGLPRTGQKTSYRTGDDGDLEKGFTLERPQDDSVRFTDNNDGTVTDNATGLMWIKEPVADPGGVFAGIMDWNDAIDNCWALTFAGHSDWRLPNYKEMASICDLSRNGPCINTDVFPNAKYDLYHWTSTTASYLATVAHAIILATPSYVVYSKGTDRRAWPVRGGLPV